MAKTVVGVERASEGSPLLEPRLWGTWKSDRKKTFERMRVSGSPAQQRKWRSLFGKLTVTWKRSTMSSYFDGKWWPSQVPMDPTPTLCHYRVLARSSERVIVILHEDSTRLEKAQGSPVFENLISIDFDESGYWLSINNGWAEYFRRVLSRAKSGSNSK